MTTDTFSDQIQRYLDKLEEYPVRLLLLQIMEGATYSDDGTIFLEITGSTDSWYAERTTRHLEMLTSRQIFMGFREALPDELEDMGVESATFTVWEPPFQIVSYSESSETGPESTIYRWEILTPAWMTRELLETLDFRLDDDLQPVAV